MALTSKYNRTRRRAKKPMDITEFARMGGYARARKLTAEEKKRISSKGGKAAKKARRKKKREVQQLAKRRNNE